MTEKTDLPFSLHASKVDAVDMFLMATCQASDACG